MRLIDADALWMDVIRSVDYCDDILEFIERQPTVEQSHWIPCSERLPEEDHWLGGSGRQFSDNVLISILNTADKDEWVYVAQTIDGDWALELSRYCKVIAWQPLPSPYREEADE